MEEGLLFTQDEWDAAIPDVVKAMTDFLRPYRTPIYEDCDGYGDGWGSGAYIQLGEQVFILTNEHVSCVRDKGKILAYQFDGQDDIRRIVGNHIEYPAPIDLGLLPLNMEAWTSSTHNSKAIGLEKFAFFHSPVFGELMTFTGFSGDKVNFYFDTLCAEGTCYTAREIALPSHSEINPQIHFGIDYRPDKATTVIGTSGLPCPPGFSGSVVWNTGFVEAKMNGVPWTPDRARVTGIVWGWPSGNGCLVATRVEYIRSFLLSAVTC